WRNDSLWRGPLAIYVKGHGVPGKKYSTLSMPSYGHHVRCPLFFGGLSKPAESVNDPSDTAFPRWGLNRQRCTARSWELNREIPCLRQGGAPGAVPCSSFVK